MSKEENLKKTLRSGKRKATRIVTLSSADRQALLETALAKTRQAKAKPKPQPTVRTSKVFDDLIEFLVQSEPCADPEHIVQGALDALQSGIMGGNFVAPAEATLLGRVKRELIRLQAADEGNDLPAAETADAEQSATQNQRVDNAPQTSSRSSTLNDVDDGLDPVHF